jgi:hypothetical protein
MEVVNAMRFCFAFCQSATDLPTLPPIHLATCENTMDVIINIPPLYFKGSNGTYK